jgi:hypothetical protein
MRTVTEQFTNALSGSHQIAVEVSVVQTGDVLQGISDGAVTLDGTAAIRGSLDLTIIDDGSLDLVPTAPNDLLAPYGNELQVKRGITFADGTTEYVSLGIFRIDTVEVSDTGTGTEIRISGLDRAARVSDAKFTTPGEVTATTEVGTAIEDIVADGYANLTTRFEDVTYGLPRVAWEEGADRWELAQRLATLSGGELYFDGDGFLVLRQVPSARDSAVADIVEGDNGVLLSVARRWTRENTFNRVIVTGESMSAGVPYRGDVYDDDSSSPTYYFGNFGEVIQFERSDVVGSAAQAEAAAQGMLDKVIGTFAEVNFGAIVQPHLEPGDVVRVTRTALGVDENHVIDSMTIPLTVSSEMGAKTRGVVVT